MVQEILVKDLLRTENGVAYQEKQLSPKNMKDICSFYKIPYTLVTVDAKYGTNTFGEVLRTVTDKIQIIESIDSLQVMDPKSKFLEDKSFNIVIEDFQKSFGIEPIVKSDGLYQVAEFKVEDVNTDEAFGDLFSKSLKVERLPQGGVLLNTALLRLACTNGMVVPDSQFRTLLRTSKVSKEIMSNFVESTRNFNVKSYFEHLFIKDGVEVQASVADYFEMRRALESMLEDGEEIIDKYFPTEPLDIFYQEAKIDLSTISRRNLTRLPSGLSYYNCFNILTNGAKLVPNTVENQIRVASFASPSKIKQLIQTEITVKGSPFFSDLDVKSRMGDI